MFVKYLIMFHSDLIRRMNTRPLVLKRALKQLRRPDATWNPPPDAKELIDALMDELF
jgi:hypothetical protein